MRKYFSLLTFLLSALCLGFTSCGDDDDSTTSGNNNTSGSTTTTDTRQLSKVTMTDTDEENFYTSTVLDGSVYLNGKISYGTFTMVDEDGSHPGTCTVVDMGLGNLGATIKYTSRSEVLYGPNNTMGFFTSIANLGSYEYNDDGQLTLLTDKVDDSVIEYTYSNGDLIKLVAKDLDTHTAYIEADFTYDGALENKGNLPFNFMFMGSTENMLLSLYGYLGNSTKHLPTSVSGQKITWTFDNQGYPTSMKGTNGTGATFAWR